MTSRRTLRSQWCDRGRWQRDDRGSTLLEVLVGMIIMMIFLGVFTGAIVLLYQSSNKAIALTTSAGQTDQAFSRLDRSIRYAAAFDKPVYLQVPATTGWSVEYRTAVSTSGSAASLCTQIVLNSANQPANSARLQAISWTLSADGTTITNNSGWITWASQLVSVPATAAPPLLAQAIPGKLYEQLQVQLSAQSGSPPVPAGVNATFTALNSGAAQQAAAASGVMSSGCGTAPSS